MTSTAVIERVAALGAQLLESGRLEHLRVTAIRAT